MLFSQLKVTSNNNYSEPNVTVKSIDRREEERELSDDGIICTLFLRLLPENISSYPENLDFYGKPNSSANNKVPVLYTILSVYSVLSYSVHWKFQSLKKNTSFLVTSSHYPQHFCTP